MPPVPVTSMAFSEDRHQAEQRVEPQRPVEHAGVVFDRVAHIGVLLARAREQLHGQDVGVAVDDAAGQHRARFRHLFRAVAHARHEARAAARDSRRTTRTTGNASQGSAEASRISALVPYTRMYQTPVISATTVSRIAGPVCITRLAMRPAKSFWKNAQDWRTTCQWFCQRMRFDTLAEIAWLVSRFWRGQRDRPQHQQRERHRRAAAARHRRTASPAGWW